MAQTRVPFPALAVILLVMLWPLEAGAGEVTIEVSGIASSSSLRSTTLSRLLAWKKGALCGVQEAGFTVTAILKGTLYDPGYASRPVGTNHLDVLVLNDALMALRKGGGSARGVWTITELPDGSFVVEDPKNTPYGNVDISSEKRAVADAFKDLSSRDPKRQLPILEKLEELQCFLLVPAVIALLESQATVLVPFEDPFGRGAAKIKKPLCEIAADSLERFTQPLRSRRFFKIGNTSAAWMAWWKMVLATEAFPTVTVEPGDPVKVSELAMNQTHPEPFLDPSGRHAVVAVSGLQEPVNGARAGIRLLDLDALVADDFEYKVPLGEGGRIPTDLAVAWNARSVGMIWQECRYEPKKRVAKFLALDLKGLPKIPVILPLERLDRATVVPLEAGAWLLVGTSEPKEGGDSEKKDLFLMVLDSSGNVRKKIATLKPPVPCEGMMPNEPSFAAGIATPKGPALVFRNDGWGAYLVLLDREQNVRQAVKVNNPEENGHTFHPGIATDGSTLLIAWNEEDNQGERLFIRGFDLDGRPLSDPRQIADDSSDLLGGPVAWPMGYLVAWLDHSQTPNQVRLASVGAAGDHGPIRVVHLGRDWIGWLGLGFDGAVARVMAYDTTHYPHWLWLKKVALPKP